MSANSIWNRRLEMLMACASPGSAIAYYELQASVLRRDKTTGGLPASGGGAVNGAIDTDRKLGELLASSRVVALP